jgi:hypothetical protein
METTVSPKYGCVSLHTLGTKTTAAQQLLMLRQGPSISSVLPCLSNQIYIFTRSGFLTFEWKYKTISTVTSLLLLLNITDHSENHSCIPPTPECLENIELPSLLTI